jgi:hypothetical protein
MKGILSLIRCYIFHEFSVGFLGQFLILSVLFFILFGLGANMRSL